MEGGFARKRKKGLGRALSGGLLSQLLGETGNTISDADRARLQAMMGSSGVGAGAAAALGETGKSISNADRARIQELLGSMKSPRPKTDRQLMQFEKGGKVKNPKKYTGPLPLPKPTPLERFLGARSVNKPTNAEEQERIGNKMAKKFKKSKKAQRYEDGGAAFPDLTGDGKVTKKDILRGRGVKGFKEGGSTISDANSKKIKKILPKLFVPGESGTSDADSKKIKKILPKLYPIEKGKNISDADKSALKKLMKPTNFKDGGEVRGMGRAYMGASRKAKIR